VRVVADDDVGAVVDERVGDCAVCVAR
jgi:hypothetical protein